MENIQERLKELLEENTEEENGLTIVLQGSPVINIYLGSEE